MTEHQADPLAPVAIEYQWGVRTQYADGSSGTDWTNEDDAQAFLSSYADYDASPFMGVKNRELVRRPIQAGDVEVVESCYTERRAAAEARDQDRRAPRGANRV